MLDAEGLIDTARVRAKLADFGTDSWRGGFERLVRAYNTESALNSAGEAQVSSTLVAKLVNRLEIEDWHRRHPDIAEQTIRKPIFGIGLPRTGSTALGVMLGQDPARRALRTWEAARPCPPPETSTQFTDPRIGAAQAGLDAMLLAIPGAGAMIPVSADAATECLIVMSMDFHSMEFEALGRVGSYVDWLLQCDMVPTYRFHKRTLQLLQWRCPPDRWFLRSPTHSPFIGALDKVYPDARFVMTHRDIAKVMSSNLAFLLLLSKAYTAQQNVQAMAQHMIAFWETALRRLIAFRDAGNEHRFFDMDFADFQSEPLYEIRRFYGWLGEPLSDMAERNMLAWWTHNAEERTVSSGSIPAELGIAPGELSERFAFYSDRFVRKS